MAWQEIDRRYSKSVSWGRMAESDPRGPAADSGTSRILNDLNMSMIVARGVYASARLLSNRHSRRDDDRHICSLFLSPCCIYVCTRNIRTQAKCSLERRSRGGRPSYVVTVARDNINALIGLLSANSAAATPSNDGVRSGRSAFLPWRQVSRNPRVFRTLPSVPWGPESK